MPRPIHEGGGAEIELIPSEVDEDESCQVTELEMEDDTLVLFDEAQLLLEEMEQTGG